MRFCIGALALVMTSVLAGTPAQASSVPGQVGRVTMKQSTTTSLTFKWPKAARADEYLIEQATNLGMTDRTRVATTTERRITVDGLRPGQFYCFQVRGLNDSGQGMKSRKACQYTIAEQGADTGATYRVVTYNTCGVACPGWASRLHGAAELVGAQQPDVVALQETPEDSGMAGALGDFTQVQAKSGKALLFRKSRFDVARESGKERSGILDLGLDPRAGKHRYAVWAELIDRQNSGKRVIFASVHLSPGGDDLVNDDFRRRETINLIAGLRRINPDDLPLVVAGDFNSNQGRTYDSPTALMDAAGYGNAFYFAEKWVRPNYNSANKDTSVPSIGTPWGYHVDQVWTDPERSQIVEWRNANRLVNGNYPAPLVSNHSPVSVEVRIN